MFPTYDQYFMHCSGIQEMFLSRYATQRGITGTFSTDNLQILLFGYSFFIRDLVESHQFEHPTSAVFECTRLDFQTSTFLILEILAHQ